MTNWKKGIPPDSRPVLAVWETDRAILALIALKNAPSYEENQDEKSNADTIVG